MNLYKKLPAINFVVRGLLFLGKNVPVILIGSRFLFSLITQLGLIESSTFFLKWKKKFCKKCNKSQFLIFFIYLFIFFLNFPRLLLWFNFYYRSTLIHLPWHFSKMPSKNNQFLNQTSIESRERSLLTAFQHLNTKNQILIVPCTLYWHYLNPTLE